MENTMRDLDKVSEQIIHFIDCLYVDKNSVIVYDIDNTLIDNQGNPMYPIIKTFYHAKSKGLKTGIVTARPGFPSNVERTKDELSKYFISDYEFLYFMPESMIQSNIEPGIYKLFARKDIYDRGFNTVMSIGDMPWDVGLFGGFGFIV
jgi:hypothetical protein